MNADQRLDEYVAKFYETWDGPILYTVCMPVIDRVTYFDVRGNDASEGTAFAGTKQQASILMVSQVLRDVFKWTRLVPLKVMPRTAFTRPNGIDPYLSFPTMLGGRFCDRKEEQVDQPCVGKVG